MAEPKVIRARLIERRDPAKDIAVFRFEPEEDLVWEPGQYATFGIPGEGKPLERPYSITSSPHEKTLELFVELVPDGALTPLFWKLKVGDTITVRSRTAGTFTVDRESGRKTHFMVATVTGAAPFISALRFHAHQLEGGRDEGFRFVLLHGGSRSWELGYIDELSRLQESGDWLRYVPTVSRPWEDPEWKGETGRAEDLIRKYLDGLETSDVTAYLCGRPEMIEKGKEILKRAGVPEDQVKEEEY